MLSPRRTYDQGRVTALQIIVTIVVLALLASLFPGAPSVRAAAPFPRPATRPVTGMKSLAELKSSDPESAPPAKASPISQDWWASVLALIERDMYSVQPVSEQSGDGFRTTNASFGFVVTFPTSGGFRVSPAADLSGDTALKTQRSAPNTWNWGLRPQAVGSEIRMFTLRRFARRRKNRASKTWLPSTDSSSTSIFTRFPRAAMNRRIFITTPDLFSSPHGRTSWS